MLVSKSISRVFSGLIIQVSTYCQSTVKMAPTNIKDVDIDSEGVFKYILIKLSESQKGSGSIQHIVRGYKRCPYHADIYEEVEEKELEPNKIKSRCLGGGFIRHDPSQKKIKVFGYSQGFGRADHTVSVDILKKAYPEYSITWSNDDSD